MEWIDPPPASELSALPGFHPLVGKALMQRGCRTAEAARAFLDPKYYSPTAATEIPGLTAAVEYVFQAIQQRQPICVWGDFDVDGQTSTTILVQTLQELGAKVTYHIPVREREGHGVNIPLLTEIIDNGARLVLTCDTGIGAIEAVEYAHSRGVEMVITDHHDLPERIPPAEAVANPKFLPEGHLLSTLSGSGLAYKFAEELYHRGGKPGGAESLLDLACLGLVADVARLTGDARYLVQRGLQLLRASNRLGLRAIYDYAKLIPDHLTEEHIGYEIAPRLNALGRLGDAKPAVELFTTANPARARVLANILEGLNIQRQLLCSQITRAAEAQLREQPSLLEEPVLVLAGPGWPAGVVGIAASRLVDRYHKPAILLSVPPDGPARGSARSVEGINITAAIARQSDLLLSYGGHPMAAGLALEADKLPEFRVRLARTVESLSGTTVTIQPFRLDAWLDLTDLSMELADSLESLAPYGPGNEELVLATRDLVLESSAKIGRNLEHLKLSVADEDGNSQTVLWWNGAEEELPEGHFDLAYTLRASDWRGTPQLQMEWLNFRLKESETIRVESPRIEVVDCRHVQDPAIRLAEICGQGSTVVWAEGADKKQTGGNDRIELAPADHLVVWTTPASPEELNLVVEKVCPQTIYLFAAGGAPQTAEAFLNDLAGLLKYAVMRKGGKLTWAELAAATAQKKATIRHGVEWLAARGKIQFSAGAGDDLVVETGDSMKDPEKAAQLWAGLQSLLAESAAYRAHFQQANKDSLFPPR